MDMFDFAGMLFGGSRTAPDATTVTATGAGASDGGEVGITLDADVTPAEDTGVEGDADQTVIDLPTSPDVDEGDELIVTLVGDGPLKTPVVTANPGSGDRMRALANSAKTIADAAQAVAEAVNQHFFADTSGIHVTEATQEDWDENHTGANVLINALGQLFRDGLNNLLTLTTENGARALTIWDGLGNAAGNIRAVIGETIQLGKASGSHVTIDDDSMEYYANETEQVFQFVGSKDGDDSLTSYYATIRDGITRTGDTIIPPQKSRIRLMTTTRQSGSEKVVISSNAELYAYTRNGEGASISVDMLNDTDGTKMSNVYLSADAIQALGTTFVNDPYRNGYQLELGSPTRMTASGNYTAGTADTMGPAVTLTAGIWVVNGIWNFANSSSNAKRLVIGLYRSSLSSGAYTYRVHTTASSSSAHRLEVVDFIVVSAASETVTLYGASSPASTSAATQYITAVRLV